MQSIATYGVFGSVLASALLWYGDIAWSGERRPAAMDGKSSIECISDDGRVFFETLEKERLALAQAPVTNLVTILRRPLQDEKSLSEVDRQLRSCIDSTKYSGASWYLIAELLRCFNTEGTNSLANDIRRYLAAGGANSAGFRPDAIRDLVLKSEAFNLLMQKNGDEAWAYVRERSSSNATLTDALIGDRVDRSRRWYSAGNWQSVFEGTNVVFRYVAIARLNVWCPKDQRGRIVRSALADPHRDVREVAIQSLPLLDSKTAIDCARAYLLKWSGRSAEITDDGERAEAEYLLQRAQEYLKEPSGP
jgi:hypothetical protein